MIEVYKFTTYTTYKVNPRVTACNTPGTKLSFSFQLARDRNVELITPVPKRFEIISKNEERGYGKINMKPLLNTITDFTFEDKVYIHSNCTIPRAKVTQKYTRVLKADRADICVVPSVEECNTETVALFINKDKEKIYVIEEDVDWCRGKIVYYTAKKCSSYSLGSSVLDIYPSLKDTYIEEKHYYGDNNNTYSIENWNDFLNSTLLYYGPAVSLFANKHWIADLLYNKLHDVVTEDKILATLGDITNEFTQEACDNIKEMLNSSNSSVVGLGLKSLAEMDYEKYHNTAVHLLCSSDCTWTANSMKSSASVKYMLNRLGLWGNTREHYIPSTQEDFDLMKQIVRNDFARKIQDIHKSFLSRFPFATIDLKYSFEVLPKPDNEEVSSGEEDDDFDY